MPATDLVYLVECEDCQRQVRIDLTEMASRITDPLEWMRERLRCGCGSSRFFITTLRQRLKS